MNKIDETRPFKPVNIAVLTVSDTRTLETDKSGDTLIERIARDGHVLVDRAIVTDDVDKIRAQVRKWIDDPKVEVVISTGGTGVTGRDVTPEAMEGLYEKKIDGFGETFRWISFQKIGTSTMQSRATAGVANGTYIFALPGSTGACKDGWDDILRFQLDIRFRPCNFAELMPRLNEGKIPEVVDDFLAVLKAGTPLPATGTAHGHVLLRDGRLARVAYAHEGDASAAGRLHAQAAAFRHLEPAGRTPRLHEVIDPRPGLPGGALVVDFIDGRAPRLPDELELMADTLARIHALRLPPASAPIPRQSNPFLETLEGIELNAARFLDKAVPDAESRAEIADELSAMRGLVPVLGRKVQPLTVALADTHPGNFIVDRAGIAWFVDLEKVHVGSPAIDLAHATLPTSTWWHPDVGTLLTRAEVEGFYDSYLARIGSEKAEALRPWIVPMRRLTWLRTTLFMARWRVETSGPRDRANTTQWSDAGLDHNMKRHIDARIDQCFTRGVIRSIRNEWVVET